MAEDSSTRSCGVWTGFRRECGKILQEIAPGFLNWVQDWRMRRKTMRSFDESRPKQTTYPRPIGENNSAAADDASAGNDVKARALPQLSAPLARRARIAAWHMLRPVLRWQHRSSPAAVLGIYFGILCALSVSASVYFLLPRHQKDPVPAAEEISAEVALLLNASGDKLSPQRQAASANSTRLLGQAEKEFRAGRYAAAELLFRKALPTARFPALTGFQIFLCLLKQGKTAEAKSLAGKFPPSASIINPSGIFVHAAYSLRQSRPEDARLDIESARRRFPMMSPFYEKALADAALAPAP